METNLVPFEQIMADAEWAIFICHDPCHCHRSPIQEMTAVWYRNHRVAITRDATVYSVRIDRRPITDRYGMSESEVIAYVNEKCAEVCNV